MLITRFPQTAAAMTAGPSRSLCVALAALLAALAMTVAAAPAHAKLSAVGPINPRTSFPDWYQDGGGLKLQLCMDGLPVCSAAPGDLVAPNGEAFYWRAQGDLTSGTLHAKMALGQEAAFAGGPVTFGRIRATVVGAQPNTVYTVRDPYGSLTLTTDVNGIGKSTTDIGCGASPCDWAAALGTTIGPFLHWDPTAAPAPQPGYIGDAATPHKVVGSPTGFNGFSISGGGVALTTNLLTVEGKLAGPPVPDIDIPTSTDFGAPAVGTPTVQTIGITSMGVPDAGGASNLMFGNMAIGGPNASEFTIVGNTCSGRALPSGSTCALNVQFTPTAGGPRGAELDIQHNAFGGGTRILLNGTGAVPGAGVASATASRLAIRKLRTTHRMSRARVARNGLRLSMVVPQGTEIIKIAVNRIRNNKVVRKPVWVGFRVAPSRAGLYRLTLDSRTLRRRMKVGLYVIKVTPGASKQQLGQTTTTRIRITRH